METRLKNCHTKLFYFEPRDNPILKSKFLCSKIKLFYVLILFKRGWISFLKKKKYFKEKLNDYRLIRNDVIIFARRKNIKSTWDFQFSMIKEIISL